MSLAGKRTLVTGAASGIGEATARRLVAEGARVVLFDHSDAVEALAAELPGTLAAVGSVTDNAAVAAAVALAVTTWGGLDVVVSNAGITHAGAPPSELEDMTDEEWDGVLGVNLGGTFRIARAAMPALRASGMGRLICVASVVGIHQGWPTRVHYAASKGGVEGLVRCLATEVAAYGVAVVGVAPGITRTPQALDPASSGAAGLERIEREHIPSGVAAEAEEMAALIAFLARDESRPVSGTVVLADSAVSVRSVNHHQPTHPLSTDILTRRTTT
jgi:NAD(P)-dependent dehydrogenase (short-subunit alcohol dehydrogenase family)